MDQIKIGRFIASLRKERNMTQKELGEKLCVTGKTVSRWETGNYMPDIETLQLLGKVFNISIDELLDGMRSNSIAPLTSENGAEPKTHKTVPFSRAELESFRKRKWRREHISSFILCGVINLLLLVFLPKARNIDVLILLCFLPILILIEYGFFNNKMMAYVESRIYDGETVFTDEKDSSGNEDKQ